MTASGPTSPTTPTRDRSRSPRFALGLLLLLGLAAGAGWYLLYRPRLEFTNMLAAPVSLIVGDDTPITILPGARAKVRLARGRTMVAQWTLVRPLSADGRPMGEEVRGSSVLRGPSGTLRVSSGSRTPDEAFFAPLITNASSTALRVTVNAGLRGTLDCGCAVRPGGRRVFIGYYRLYQNSTVAARAAGTGTAVFRALGPQVTARDGTVGLRFEDRDLRP